MFVILALLWKELQNFCGVCISKVSSYKDTLTPADLPSFIDSDDGGS